MNLAIGISPGCKRRQQKRRIKSKANDRSSHEYSMYTLTKFKTNNFFEEQKKADENEGIGRRKH